VCGGGAREKARFEEKGARRRKEERGEEGEDFVAILEEGPRRETEMLNGCD
jgi:hypothetical protein